MKKNHTDDDVPPNPPAFIKGFSQPLQKVDANLNEIIVKAMTSESVSESHRWGSDVIPVDINLKDVSGYGGGKTYIANVRGRDYAPVVFHTRAKHEFVDDALGERDAILGAWLAEPS